MAPLQYLKNVVTLELNVEKCIGCKMCVNVCPHNVFEFREKKSYIISKDNCMECGACVKNCPSEAINVKSGVGCAAAIIKGFVTNTEPSCDCSSSSCS